MLNSILRGDGAYSFAGEIGGWARDGSLGFLASQSAFVVSPRPLSDPVSPKT